MAISLSTGGRVARVMATLLAVPLGAAPMAFAQSCQGDKVETGQVRAVLDGRSLVLESGRIVRLAGVALPATARDPHATPATDDAAEYLRESLADREIIIKNQGLATDRHGRLTGFVFVPRDLEASVQHAMLERGLVRVSPRAGDRACAASLWAREQRAREARLGLWAHRQDASHSAEDPAAVRARRGRLALVEGKVLSVRESGGTIYVNFGRRWAEDFTVTLARRQERALAAGGLDVRRLEHRTVRVRGYVEERGGPWIEVTRPEQIEVMR